MKTRDWKRFLFATAFLAAAGAAAVFAASRAERGNESGEPADGAAIESELFSQMPDTFYFMSGAGAWSTELYLQEDGAFTGVFHDSDMGFADPQRYPNGTVYICEFNGVFTQPEKIDDYTYSVHVQALEYDAPETESIVEGIRYITSTPYGLDDVDEVLIYLPGYPVENLSEEVFSWVRSAEEFWEAVPETLPFYVLNNVNGKQAFFSKVE